MTFTRDALGDKIINRIGGYEKLTKKHRPKKRHRYPPELSSRVPRETLWGMWLLLSY